MSRARSDTIPGATRTKGWAALPQKAQTVRARHCNTITAALQAIFSGNLEAVNHLLQSEWGVTRERRNHVMGKEWAAELDQSGEGSSELEAVHPQWMTPELAEIKEKLILASHALSQVHSTAHYPVQTLMYTERFTALPLSPLATSPPPHSLTHTTNQPTTHTRQLGALVYWVRWCTGLAGPLTAAQDADRILERYVLSRCADRQKKLSALTRLVDVIKIEEVPPLLHSHCCTDTTVLTLLC